MQGDTIFAVGSGRVKAAVSVIRISGPFADDALRLFGVALPEPRTAVAVLLKDPAGGIIDQALVLRFASGRSFTGENMVELHCHGGRAVLQAVLDRLGTCEGFRMAEPGEFTRRALLSGKFDLVQAEGLADLIDAETEEQRAMAIRQYDGELARKTVAWREGLVETLSLTEAGIDFADEELPDLAAEIVAGCRNALEMLERELAGAAAAERLREGFEVALVGPPNVGKSSLVNRLASRDVAIVTEVAGTTRDVLEVRLDLGGLPVTVLDMAGVRESGDAVERLGVAHAIRRAEAADIRVFLSEDGVVPGEVAFRDGDLLVRAKADSGGATGELAVSGLTGAGIGVLLDALHEALKSRTLDASSLVRERHRRAVEKAVHKLQRAVEHTEAEPVAWELVAENLRLAIRALDGLIGRVDVEHLLDEIFQRFCLGK